MAELPPLPPASESAERAPPPDEALPPLPPLPEMASETSASEPASTESEITKGRLRRSSKKEEQLDQLQRDKEMLEAKLREVEEAKQRVKEAQERIGKGEALDASRLKGSSSSPLTLRSSSALPGSPGEPRILDLSMLPRDVVFSILHFLSDSDLYSVSQVNKRFCMYCFSDILVFERRLKKQFPFDMTAMWRLISKRYPALGLAGSMLSLAEKTAVVNKYLRDVIDVNPNKWDIEAFDLFVSNGVCSASDKAIFYLFNVMRNPALRSTKVIDRFFGDAALMKQALELFDLSSCTLFEALHVVFGHALSLPGEAQKIDRVMEQFGAAYHRSCNPELRKGNTPDSFFILAFAMVMLNSDLHNPAVKNRMTLAQFARNLEGAIVLSPEVTNEMYLQVLRCEMLEGSYFISKLNKPVWLVRAMGPLGYKRTKKASVTLYAGELTVDGTSERYSLRNCLIARNIGSYTMSTIRSGSSGATDMNLLHVVRIGPDDDVSSLISRRFSGDLIVTTDDVEDLKELQRAMSSHLLPVVQSKLNATLRNIQQKLSV